MAAWLTAPVVPAGAADDDVPTVTVVAYPERSRGPLVTRERESDADLTGFVEVVRTDEAWRQSESVADLLDRSVGVQVRSLGARGDFATLSVRGSRAGQVRVLVDGISLTRADDPTVNLATIPLSAIERIEVYRGFTPVGFAASGASSVINLVTARSDESRLGIAAGLGSFSTASLALRGAAPLGDAQVTAFAEFSSTDGDFDFVDDRGTLANDADDVERKRENNERDAVDLLLRYERELAGGGRLTLRESFFRADEGVPGQGAFQSRRANFESTRNVVAAAWQSADGLSALEADLLLLDEDFEDPRVFDPGPPPRVDDIFASVERSRSQTLATTARARSARTFGQHHFAEASVEGGYERFRGRFPGGEFPESSPERGTLAVAAGDEIALPGLDAAVALQLRYQGLFNRFEADELPFAGDFSDADEHSVDPRVGLLWSAAEGFDVKANAATYLRPPSFGELFGVRGFNRPNPDLEPESGLVVDAGFGWRRPSLGPLGPLGVEYAFFANEIDDVIVVVQTTNRVAKAVNVPDGRVRGHELSFDIAAPWGFALEGNYTHQRTRNRSTDGELRGKELPSLPANEAYGRLSWNRGPWTLAYEARYADAHFVDTTNSPRGRIDARVQHDLGLVYGPRAGFQVALEVDNVGDTLVPDQIGFPVPGRAWYLTVSWSGRVDELPGTNR